MVPHSSTLAWKIPWTEEPGGLPSVGSHRVEHDLATEKQQTTAVRDKLWKGFGAAAVSSVSNSWAYRLSSEGRVPASIFSSWVGKTSDAMRAADLWTGHLNLLDCC